MAAESDRRPVMLVGVGGPSASGKSTLAQWLARLLDARILHQDRFYHTDSRVPRVQPPGAAEPVLDWDCPAAMDMPAFARAVADARRHGLAADAVGDNRPIINDAEIPDGARRALRTRIAQLTPADAADGVGAPARAGTRPADPAAGSKLAPAHPPRVATPGALLDAFQWVIVDGFLIYDDPAVYEQLDVCLFLHASQRTLAERRAARTGYVTTEGFWQDPPGYFEHVVWPNYLQYNRRAIAQLETEAKGAAGGAAADAVLTDVSTDGDAIPNLIGIASDQMGVYDMVSHAFRELVLSAWRSRGSRPPDQAVSF